MHMCIYAYSWSHVTCDSGTSTTSHALSDKIPSSRHEKPTSSPVAG